MSKIILFQEPDYSDALIGETIDGRAVYDYDAMVKWLQEKENLEEKDAIEFIEFNTLSALTEGSPVVIRRKEHKK